MVAGSNFVRTKAKPLNKLSVDFNKIQKAKIKSVIDLSHNGKLLVWLVDSNTNEDLTDNWISVNYASPFAGSTDRSKVNRHATNSYTGTQKSYGFFAVPPDVNNYVLVAFANGDATQGYWIACIYQDGQTHMLPGIGQNTPSNSSPNPVAEMNIYSGQIGSPQVNPTRPPYTPLLTGLTTQGLLHDPLRGAGTSSVWRDTTPTVCGILSPSGSQLIFDDGSTTQMIRLRTQSGAQILISETAGHIYAINKSGTGWIEINDNGNMYSYCTGSYNVSADQDINLSAGRNVNISGGTVNIQSTNGGNLSLRADGTLNLFGGTEINSITPFGTGSTAVPPSIQRPAIVPTHEPFVR